MLKEWDRATPERREQMELEAKEYVKMHEHERQRSRGMSMGRQSMEEKLFELMAQAEDLQKHAAKLQNEAENAFSALPLAVPEQKYFPRASPSDSVNRLQYGQPPATACSDKNAQAATFV